MKKIITLLAIAIIFITGCSAPENIEVPENLRIIDLEVTPEKQEAGPGDTVTLSLTITAQIGDVNGVKIYTEGPWPYLLDKEVQGGKLVDGKWIISDKKLKPGEKATITIKGTLDALLKPKSWPEEFRFRASKTGDGKRLSTGKELSEVAYLVVLPE